jgi:hypothetical protein
MMSWWLGNASQIIADGCQSSDNALVTNPQPLTDIYNVVDRLRKAADERLVSCGSAASYAS